MSTPGTKHTPSLSAPAAEGTSRLRHSAVRTLAKSLFRELAAQGFTPKHVVALATALLGEVTASMSSKNPI